MMTGPKFVTRRLQWAWHVHHERLLEPLTEPIEDRIAYVQAQKPAHEAELRLRLLKPVRGDLTRAKAYAAQEKADAAWQKAYAAWEKAYAAWEKADAALPMDPAVLALHAQECPSPPCTWNGTTIFPEAFIVD